MKCYQCDQEIGESVRVQSFVHQLPGVGLVSLENIKTNTCKSCGHFVVDVTPDEIFHVSSAIVRELLKLPILTGSIFSWIRKHLVGCAEKYEDFAKWLGFEGYYFLKKWGLSFSDIDPNNPPQTWFATEKINDTIRFQDEVSLLIAEKLDLKDVFELSVVEDLQLIPAPLEKKFREMAALVKDEEFFSSRTLMVDGNATVCVNLIPRRKVISQKKVSMAGLRYKKNKSDHETTLDLKDINEIFEKIGRKKMELETFKKIVRGKNIYAVVIRHAGLEGGKIIAFAICVYYSLQQVEIVTICMNLSLGNEKVLNKLLLGIIGRSQEEGFKKVVLRKPRQSIIESVAVDLGFQVLKKGYYYLNLELRNAL